MISTLTRYAIPTWSMETLPGCPTMGAIEEREPQKPAENISGNSLIGFGV